MTANGAPRNGRGSSPARCALLKAPRFSPQVQSLSELATASSAAAAHEVAPCAVIKGIRGFASFVNGTYRRVENYLHEDR